MSQETRGILKRLAALFLAILAVAWIGLHGSSDRVLKATEMEEETVPETEGDGLLQEEEPALETVSLVLPAGDEPAEMPEQWLQEDVSAEGLDGEAALPETVLPPEEQEIPEGETLPEELAVPEEEVPEEQDTPEEQVWPAQKLYATAPDGALIRITAPEGALPEGCFVTAGLVPASDAESSVDAVRGSGREIVDMAAYTIVIYGPDGAEIQPAAPVQVSIRRPAGGGASQDEIYHVEEDGTAEKVAETV